MNRHRPYDPTGELFLDGDEDLFEDAWNEMYGEESWENKLNSRP